MSGFWGLSPPKKGEAGQATQDRLPPSPEGCWQLRPLQVTAETAPKRSRAPGVRDGPRRRARPGWQRHRDRSPGDLPKARLGD